MSNEIEITVSGWVGSHPRLVESARGTRVLNVRVGSTPRRRDPATGVWFDGPTEWFTVVAFRDLAANAAHSLHKGDPVVVRGRLSFSQWEHDGRTHARNEITADAIGHNLVCGTSLFARSVRRNGEERPEPREWPARDSGGAEPWDEGPDRDGASALVEIVDLDDLSDIPLPGSGEPEVPGAPDLAAGPAGEVAADGAREAAAAPA